MQVSSVAGPTRAVENGVWRPALGLGEGDRERLVSQILHRAVYGAAGGQGRNRVLGADNMRSVTDERIGNVRRAEHVITAARRAERRVRREPDDAPSTRCFKRSGQVAETLTDDRGR